MKARGGKSLATEHTEATERNAEGKKGRERSTVKDELKMGVAFLFLPFPCNTNRSSDLVHFTFLPLLKAHPVILSPLLSLHFSPSL